MICQTSDESMPLVQIRNTQLFAELAGQPTFRLVTSFSSTFFKFSCGAAAFASTPPSSPSSDVIATVVSARPGNSGNGCD